MDFIHGNKDAVVVHGAPIPPRQFHALTASSADFLHGPSHSQPSWSHVTQNVFDDGSALSAILILSSLPQKGQAANLKAGVGTG
nr:hypothetical protein [Rhizobium sp. BK176]